MTGRITSHIRRLIVSLLILLGITGPAFPFQKTLSGNLNQPKAAVSSIPARDRVIVDDATGFKSNDTILFIQMQGVGILTGPGDYGNIQTFFGQPGMHEFMIVQSVNTNEIIFRNETKNIYDTRGNIQIVRVPYYNSAKVTGTLFCDPWSPVTKKGGVLALIIGRSLTLNADIDMSAKGFSGGGDAAGDGICVQTAPVTNARSYPGTFTNAGYKGEGIAIHDEFGALLAPTHMKGKAPNFTGGGGGNGRFSGGGGGSNRGKGGIGGFENNDICISPQKGGIGGIEAETTSFPSLVDRIYMGGGGGASTSLSGLSNRGGRGGGIVIIVTDTIIGAGGKIITNGEPGTKGVANGGSGGGGAGGSIALSLDSYGQSPLTFSVSGGKGGDNDGFYGEGGGGGGGLVYINKTLTPNVAILRDGGLAGNSPSLAEKGDTGTIKPGFKAILNGFLFNSVRSSVTNDTLDWICSNITPKLLTGTHPVGSGNFTYKWQKSHDIANIADTVDLATSNTLINYQPTVKETTTVFYRRIVTDNITALRDISKWVKIIVQDSIKNNYIGYSDTICNGQIPLPFIATGSGLTGGDNIYAYTWQKSPDNINYSLAAAPNNATGYTESNPLLNTQWYRRIVQSGKGKCIDTTAIVKVTVLPKINHATNTISASQDICFGMTFANLTGSAFPALTGGDNTFVFNWEKSADGTTNWLPATGASHTAGYDPDEASISLAVSEYYRRVVFSGIHNVCKDTSARVLLSDWPVITGNLITSPDTVIGYDSVPRVRKATKLLPGNGGNGIYSYLWQSKTISWGTAPGTFIGQNYSPDTLKLTTLYRRVVNSSACSDTSNIRTVTVHARMINNTISLPSGFLQANICTGLAPPLIAETLPSPAGGTNITGDYSYKWYKSATGGSSQSEWTEITDSVRKDFQPALISSAQTIYFRRDVGSPKISPTGILKSNSIKITVLPKLAQTDIDKEQSVCRGQLLPALTNKAPGPSGGDNVYRFTWQQDSANTGWTNIPGHIYTLSPTYTKPTAIHDPFRYKRYIYSGANVYSGLSDACRDSSNIVAITINQLPVATITSMSDTICYPKADTIKIRLSAGLPNWSLVYSENGVQTKIPKIKAASGDTTITINRTPTGLLSSTYIFKLDSLTDANKCKALTPTLTGIRKITVYKTPVSIAGADALVCGPEYRLKAVASVGAGSWSKTSGPGTATFGVSDIVKVDSTSAAWGMANRYRFTWREDNWNCWDTSSVAVTFYKRVSVAKVLKDTVTLYSIDNFDTLHAVTPLIGTGTWTPVTSGPVIEKDSIARQLSEGQNSFLWKVKNGECVSSDTAYLLVYNVVIPKGISPGNLDGNNYNEELIIKNFDPPDPSSCEATMRILNTAGAEVYFTSNLSGNTWKNWKGENKRGVPLPEGTYYYLLNLRSLREANAAPRIMSGFIILKRK